METGTEDGEICPNVRESYDTEYSIRLADP